MAEIVPIPKPHDLQGVCPISLLKVMERMANPRLKYAISDIPSCIFGFTDKVGTREALATTISEVSSALRDRIMAVIVVFLDLNKAFKICSWETILELLVRTRVQGNLLAYANGLLQDGQATVKLQGVTSEYLAMENGTPQGAVLYPLLFNLPMSYLVEAKYPQGSKVTSYADDVQNITKEKKKEVLKIAQTSLDIIVVETDYVGMAFSPPKCKSMCFGKLPPTTMLTIRGSPIEWVNHHLVLGIHIDRHLKFDRHSTYLCSQIEKRLNVLRALTAPSTGANSSILRLIYIMAVSLIMSRGNLYSEARETGQPNTEDHIGGSQVDESPYHVAGDRVPVD